MSESLAFVIEDHKDIAEIFSMAVKDAGYEVEVIRNGRSALERLAQTVPDVVLLDLRLPEVEGKDILKSIRADERFCKTRVLLITAEHQRADAIKEMADLVLIKPVSFIQLRDLVERMRLETPDCLDYTNGNGNINGTYPA
jgi:two-component system KDP operon response regulator KdpE